MGNNQYFVYIATNHTNTTLYVGVTNDLARRMYEHKNKFVSSFTSKYKINKLVYYESFNDVKDAIGREKQLKAGSRQRKLDLINKSNSDFRDLYRDIL